MAKISFESNKQSIRALFFWISTSVLSGAIGTSTVYIFMALYKTITEALISFNNIPIFFYPVAGASVVGLVFYRLSPKSMGEGIPSYLEGLIEHRGFLEFKETFFKFWAALLTLSTFGNGGFIGPVGRVSAGIMSGIGKLFSGKFMKSSYVYLYSICGLSAAIAALLHSPIGAGIFAVEIIQKTDMKYKDLFPSILSSASSVFFAKEIGLEPIIKFVSIHKNFNHRITGWLLLIAIASGLAGYAYIKLYELISSLLNRDHRHRNRIIVIKVIIGSIIASLLAYFINTDIIGTSTKLYSSVFSFNIAALYGNLPQTISFSLVIIVLILFKATANCFTIGSGLSAGFAGPAMLLGLLLGMLFVNFAGITPGTPEFFAFLAAGFAGMLSSTMNTPIATAIITLELFGFAYSLPAGIASIIGFQVNRKSTLYDFALKQRESEYE